MTDEAFQFTLFVHGKDDRAIQAIARVRELLTSLSPGRKVELTVVDVAEDPKSAERWQVLATPTLLRSQPTPILRVVGEPNDPNGYAKALFLQ